MNTKRVAFAGVLVLMIAIAGVANGETGPYIGGAVGETQVDLELSGVQETGFRIDDEDFAYRIFFGYQLPGPFSIEGGFRDLGKVTDTNGLIRVTSESDGFDAFLLGALPLGPVKLFAKAGAIAWDTELTTGLTDDLGLPEVRVSDDGTGFAWGVGVSFELGRFGVRGEFENLELDLLDDLTMLSVGVTFEF